jgi:hypothetical protein
MYVVYKLSVAPSFDVLRIISKTTIIERKVICGYHHVVARLNVVSQNSPSEPIKMTAVITQCSI